MKGGTIGEEFPEGEMTAGIEILAEVGFRMAFVFRLVIE